MILTVPEYDEAHPYPTLGPLVVQWIEKNLTFGPGDLQGKQAKVDAEKRALIYRFYELVSVYGTTWKELIQEEFGDGIMSAIDFSMDIEREPDPKGDRVKIVMSGKFLPYKTY